MSKCEKLPKISRGRLWAFVGVVPIALVVLAVYGARAEKTDESLASLPVSAAQAPNKLDSNAPLRLLKVIPLPGVKGRFDHFAVDVVRQRVFVAALGNGTLEILDLRTGTHLHSVKGLGEPTGVAFAPELNRIFVATGSRETCEVLNGDTFAIIQSVTGLPDADNVRYDSAAQQIYVGYGDGVIAVLNAANGKRLGDITLAGHPESFQLETNGNRLFVNVPSAGYIAVVDRDRRAVTATWSTRGVKANYPMALDEAGHHLFVGCRQPAQELVFDTLTGGLADTQNIGGDSDDLFWDAKRARLYVSCGDGILNVFQVEGRRWSSVVNIPTAAGARTSYFVPELNRFCVAVPHRGTQSAEIRVYAVQP